MMGSRGFEGVGHTPQHVVAAWRGGAVLALVRSSSPLTHSRHPATYLASPVAFATPSMPPSQRGRATGGNLRAAATESAVVPPRAIGGDYVDVSEALFGGLLGCHRVHCPAGPGSFQPHSAHEGRQGCHRHQQAVKVLQAIEITAVVVSNVAVDLPLPAMPPYCPSTPRQAVECHSAALQQRQAAAWCIVRRETLHHPSKLEIPDGG